ncbi:MAG: hypothetical protein MRY83_15140 [Flavobacteriales bacterium]|nr:hypothetical protein [Flavobacteriales bacterium]
MKHYSIIISTISAAIMLSICRIQPKSINIYDAQNLENLEITIESNRGLNKGNLRMYVSNNGITPYNIAIVPGTFFESGKSELQNQLVMESKTLMSSSNSLDSVYLSGFCTEASDHAPGSGNPYSLARLDTSKYNRLVEFVVKNNIADSRGPIQHAIWSISDGKSVSSICPKRDSIVRQLRTLVCEVTGQEDVWYDVERKISVINGREIIAEPLEVSGNIKMENDKKMEVRGILINEQEEIIWSYPDPIKLPEGNIEFWFKLTVKNWPEGDYRISYLKNSSDTIHQQTFTL